jgi:3-oxoadipate enol-lactonase
VRYSMGGMVAQLVYRRHAALLAGLVLCSTAGNVGSPAQELAAFALPAAVAGLRWNPVLQLVSAEVLGSALLGPIDDPATASWARAQLRRTTLVSAVSAIQAACQFSSDGWISQVDIPPRSGHNPGPHRTGRPSTAAAPGDPGRIGPRGRRRSRGMHHRAADLRPNAP